MKIQFAHVLAAAGAVLAAAGQAPAQVSTQGGPVMVGADTWHADSNTHTQYYDGRVEVTQADSRLRADHITITQSATTHSGNEGWGDVISIEATGNVYYVTPTETVKGDNAIYTKADDTMIITGDVILEQDQNVMSGTRLVAQIGAGQTHFDAAPGGKTNGRVKGVFYPDSQSAAKAAGAPPPSVRPSTAATGH